MAMHVLAFTVIIIKDMSGFESEYLGDSNHAAKIMKVKVHAFQQRARVQRKYYFVLLMVKLAEDAA